MVANKLTRVGLTCYVTSEQVIHAFVSTFWAEGTASTEALRQKRASCDRRYQGVSEAGTIEHRR